MHAAIAVAIGATQDEMFSMGGECPSACGVPVKSKGPRLTGASPHIFVAVIRT
jgi:hypothetical protein